MALRRLGKLIREAIKDELTDGDFAAGQPPVTPRRPWPGTGDGGTRAVLQTFQFRDEAAESSLLGPSVTVEGASWQSISLGLRAWIGPDQYGPMSTVRAMANVKLARSLEVGLDLPAGVDPVTGMVTAVDLGALATELADEIAAQPNVIVAVGTLDHAVTTLQDAAGAVKEAATDAAREVRADLTATEDEFHRWIRVETMLASAAVTGPVRDQAIRAAGADPATYPDLDARCRASLTTDAERAAYYEKVVGLGSPTIRSGLPDAEG